MKGSRNEKSLQSKTPTKNRNGFRTEVGTKKKVNGRFCRKGGKGRRTGQRELDSW